MGKKKHTGKAKRKVTKAKAKAAELTKELDVLLKRSQEEVKDIDLFHPQSPKDECSLCFLRMPIGSEGEIIALHCCGKTMCSGCNTAICFANVQTNAKKSKRNEAPLHTTCPFCRTPKPRNDEERRMQLTNRVALNDGGAMVSMAHKCVNGEDGFEKDEVKAMQMLLRAVSIGEIPAYGYIADCYRYGITVSTNVKKQRAWLEVAVKKGSTVHRDILGTLEEQPGNIEQAIRHWTIAALAGVRESLEKMSIALKHNKCTKEAHFEAFRAYQNARKEMKSTARDLNRLLKNRD